MEGSVYHVPVLLKDAVDGLNINPEGVYVDVTFGGGGHSREVLERLSSNGHLYSFDQDADAAVNAWEDSRFTFIRSNFRYLKNWMRYYNVNQIDGLLADLGVSSHHFDVEERGFSFRFDGLLDMRMNRQARKTAADVINQYDEERLANLFYLYGELKQSRKLAALLVKARKSGRIETSAALMEVVKPVFSRDREKKELAKLFQALRIEVNEEMDALRRMLQSATQLIRPGGRLVVLTYHSLEDRMVKNLIKCGNVEGQIEQDLFGRTNTPFRAVNNKVIVAGEDELRMNPRSRSAKLRIAERIDYKRKSV